MMDKNNTVTLSLAPIAQQHLQALHDASLRILAQTGVNVHSAELREMLASAGATVEDELRVRIPPALVEEALESAPSRIELYDRQSRPAMVLEGSNCYFGTGSDLKFTLERHTQRHRQSVLRDVVDAARLSDQLANIDFVMSFALPGDISNQRIEAEQFAAMLDNTSKPAIMTVFSGHEAAETLHELACARCGGAAAFRQAPNYILYGQFISPLQHDAMALERLIFCADHAIPIIYVPTIMLGASGPVTLAGALALANAECLAGLVMHQLRAAGAPFIYGGCVSPLDMKTTVFSYGAPEWRIADAVLSQLSLRYQLPIFGTAGATDAKTIDAQAGAEWALSLLACALAGTNLGGLPAMILCLLMAVALIKVAMNPKQYDQFKDGYDTSGRPI